MSNAKCMALLFVFLRFSSFASWPASDTIIIDGEPVYIEKQMLVTNVDAFEDSIKKDFRLKPVPKHMWGVSFYTGFNLTRGTYRTSLTDMQPLDEFIQKPVSYRGNLSFGFDVSARAYRFPALNGTIDLTLHSGIGWNQIRVNCSVLEESVFVQDSIIRLRYTDAQLLLDYFVLIDTVSQFGELDTAEVGIRSNITEFSTIDIPLKLRASWSKVKSNWSLLVEAGAVMRIVKKSGDSFDNYLVNASGEYAKLAKEEFRTKDILKPTFSIGFEKKVESKSQADDQYLGIGGIFNTVLSTSFNDSALFEMNVSTYSFSLFIGYHF